MSDWWSAAPLASDLPAGPNGVPRITITKDVSADAISGIESGGNYRAVGPATRDGDRAFGKYQVMGKNIGPWTQEVLGRPLTITQFVNDPAAQDAVFKAKFGQYEAKYGPEGAARAWFAGEGGMNDLNRRDVLGTSVADYGRKFAAATGGPAMAFAQPQQSQGSPIANVQALAQPDSGNWWDAAPLAQQDAPDFNDRFQSPASPDNAPELQTALERRAADMTAGPQIAPAQQMDIGQSNLLSAATQGTSPNVTDYGGRLVSAQTFQNDAGEILYKDPQTGEVRPTDSKTQVAIRDPRDGVVKVFERSDATNESGVTGAARVLAPGLAAGAPTARPAIPMPAVRDVTPRASDIMATAKPFYRAFQTEAGKIEVPAETAQGIAERIRRALGKANLIPELAQPVYSAVGILDKGGVTTLDDLQNVKRVVGRGFNSPDKNIRDAAAVASREIGKIISEVSKPAGNNLKTADQIHSTARSVQELQRKASVAGLRAGRAGYGGNAVNSMRQVLSPIVEKAINGRTTGFRPDEIQAMRDIVEGTGATNTLRGLGQFSPSKGIFQTAGSLAGAGAGAMTFGPVGAMAIATIPALGAASNKLATILTAKQIERLSDLVAKRSPAYAAAVRKAVDRYEKAQEALALKPSPNRFAAYLSASRALSAGLTHDGIAITSGDLLRAIRGPMQSAAEDQEQPVPGVPSQ